MKARQRPGGKPNLKGPRDVLGLAKKGAKKPAKSTKSQIRDYQRLLKKAGSDAALRKSLETKLAALEREHAQASKSALEQKLARRYHKVKFVERVKIERSIHKLQRAAAAAPGGQLPPPDAARLAQLQQDLQYVLHFPKGEKYVSLLRDAADPAAQAHVESERARLRAKVAAQLAERALLTEVDEGRPSGLPASSITAQAQGVRADSGDEARDSSSSEGAEENSEWADYSSEDETTAAAAVPQPARPVKQLKATAKLQQSKRPAAVLSSPDDGKPTVRHAAEATVLPEPAEAAAASQPFQDDFFLSADTEATAAPLVMPIAAPLGKRKQTPQALAKRSAAVTQQQPAPQLKPKPRPPKAAPKPAAAEQQQPKRTRAEGGRKRRKKK